MHLISLLWQFFYSNFPTWHLIKIWFPISLLWSFIALYSAGICKTTFHFKTGYTRKLFHFLIFGTAFIYQQYLGLQGVFILGWSVTMVLLFSCIKGDGNLMYEALAREKDAPHRTKYIIYSYLATFIGGVLSNLFFAKWAILGYAITGIADAVAEPVGTMFGKHVYKVFSFDKAKVSIRSIEGSFAVFITSFIIIYCTLHFVYCINSLSFLLVIGMATACMFVEAISPSGFDNLLLQIIASGLVAYLLGS